MKGLAVGLLAMAACTCAHADIPAQSTLPKMTNPEAAIQVLTQQIDSGTLRGQQLADAFGGRCRAKAALRDISGALEDCTQSINTVDSAAVRALRGGIYVVQKDDSAALGDFAALSRLLPKNPIGHVLAAAVYWQEKNLDAYAAESDAAMALAPDRLAPLKARAELYFNNGFWSRAENDYRAILKQDQGNAELTRYLGDAQSYQGHFDEAMRNYDLALKLDPVEQAASVSMAKALAYMGREDFDSALEQARIAADKAPNSPYRLLWLQLIAAHAGKIDERDFARRSAAIDHTAWPWPLISYLLGQSTQEQAWAASSDGEPSALPMQKCEAQFYIGESLLDHDKERALSLFRQVADTCMKGNVEYAGAVYELKAMGEKITL